MPELPEVEAQRRTIEAATVGKRIVTLIALEQGGGPRDGQFDDSVIAEGVTADVLAVSLQDRWVLGVRRRGKPLWVELAETKSGAPARNRFVAGRGPEEITSKGSTRGGVGNSNLLGLLWTNATNWPWGLLGPPTDFCMGRTGGPTQ